MPLTQRTQAWRDAGKLEDVNGRRIFVRDVPGDGVPLLLLHGYPSSSFDYGRVLDRLPGRRAICFDFLGFGLSDKPRGHDYTLGEQADLAVEIAKRHGAERCAIVAHDMGTSVASELMARDLERKLGLQLDGILLLNGSMIQDKATLTISQKLLRGPLGPLMAAISNRFMFNAQFARIFSPQHPLTPDEAADQWSLLAHGGGNRIIHRLTAYIAERFKHAARWHGALRDWPGRLELLWGMRDPVATPAVLDAVLALRPQAKVTRFPELGHYPQVEDADAVARIIAQL